jgi:hypothetical protein
MALIVRFRLGEYKNGKFGYHSVGLVKLKKSKIVAENDDGQLAQIIKTPIYADAEEPIDPKESPLAFLYALPKEYGGTYINAQFDEDDDDPDPLECEQGEDEEEAEDVEDEGVEDEAE